MKFDRRLTSPCLVQETCLTPSSDTRCADPAFAAAHPDICGVLGSQRRLVIKPSIISKCDLETVQFQTFLITDGEEVELVNGLAYSSSNPAVAVIGALGGNATAVGAGIATISVTWQDLSAFAQFIGLGGDCCDEQKVGMMLVIDNSKSMDAAFSATYATRLSFAKEQAFDFAGDLNTTKDVMGVISFNEVASLDQALTDVVADVQAAILAIAPTAAGTNIDEALELAVDTLDADATLDRKVVVLVTDGFDHGADPLPRAHAFMEAGGVMVVLGTRSHSAAFTLLAAMSNGGMFINATKTNEDDVGGWFRGVKGYFCAGNCDPPGGEVVNRAQLNYEDFTNFDVTGVVDLIGGTAPYQLYDLLPGNGLYVDLSGSSAPWLGKLTSKTNFSLSAAQQYRLTVTLAGNQRQDQTGYQVRVKLGTLIDQTITIDNWLQDFTVYTYTGTPGAPTSARISVEQLASPNHPYGNLLGSVKLENVTGPATLLNDNFDTENPEYIDPACGSDEIPVEFGGGYAYGYSCYGYGCLSEPIPAQSPDSSPQDDLEEEPA